MSKLSRRGGPALAALAALAAAAALACKPQNTANAANVAGSRADSLPPLAELSRDQQIQLALSAAPSGVSDHATLYVLGPKGYVKARTGTNGFSCLVEREYKDTTVEPVCYDAAGSATTLQARLYREELRAAGLSEDQVKSRVSAAYRSGKLKAPQKPGFVYMLATRNRVWDSFSKSFSQAPPHLMFYAPYATQKDVGGFQGFQFPFVLWEGQPDAFMIVVLSGMPQGSEAHH